MMGTTVDIGNIKTNKTDGGLCSWGIKDKMRECTNNKTKTRYLILTFSGPKQIVHHKIWKSVEHRNRLLV